MIGKRRLWPYLAGAAVVLAVAAFALARLGGPDLVPVTPTAGGQVTIAGQLDMEQSGAAATAHITISADRAITLRKLTVRVRDEQGAPHDFPELANVELTTTPRDLVLNREPLAAGNYTHYLAYQLDGDWVNLPPWHQITIH